jgi:hypothetical protein
MLRVFSGYAFTAFVALQVGCVTLPPDRETGTNSSTTTPATSETTDKALSPGQYCYGIDSETLTGVVRLTMLENHRVTGDSSFTIHNEEMGYYSAYMQDLAGGLDGNQLSLDITTWIEYDVQESEAVWTITPDTLTTEDEELSAIDCEVAQERFTGPDGLDADQLLAGLDEADAIALEFPMGEQTLTYQGNLSENERQLFELYSEGGQTLDIAVTSPAGPVTFDLIALSGLVLARSEQTASVLLPHTGSQYLIVNSETTAASYELQITQDGR